MLRSVFLGKSSICCFISSSPYIFFIKSIIIVIDFFTPLYFFHPVSKNIYILIFLFSRMFLCFLTFKFLLLPFLEAFLWMLCWCMFHLYTGLTKILLFIYLTFTALYIYLYISSFFFLFMLLFIHKFLLFCCWHCNISGWVAVFGRNLYGRFDEFT